VKGPSLRLERVRVDERFLDPVPVVDVVPAQLPLCCTAWLLLPGSLTGARPCTTRRTTNLMLNSKSPLHRFPHALLSTIELKAESRTAGHLAVPELKWPMPARWSTADLGCGRPEELHHGPLSRAAVRALNEGKTLVRHEAPALTWQCGAQRPARQGIADT
jgi:hypothetical protein